MDRENIELLKHRIHIYKEKVKIATSCTIDAKKRVVNKKSESPMIKKSDGVLEKTFLP